MARHTAIGKEGGFTYLALLFMVVLLGVGLAAVGTVWQTLDRREREKELLFVGNQYRHALASFWQAVPQGQRRLPKSLDELLLDPRFPNPVRHLRRLYRDPITGSPEWGLVRDGEGVAGVHSLSTAAPLKTAGFSRRDAAFQGKSHYTEWVFAFDRDTLAPKALSAPAAQGDPAKRD